MPNEFTAKLEELYFDPANPRLIGDFGDDQDKMFRFLITDIGVDDLLESISASGLFNADPIIVRDRPKDGGYFVIEGNRRLAALKLLRGIRPNDGLPIPAVPAISSDVAKTFEALKVQSGWPDELLQAYLGYKHVTASREWSPDAKAKFVFEHAKGDYSTANLRRFAKSLGTKYPTLKRWLIAYLTLRQAEKRELFDPETAPAKGYFGAFYTLLGGQQAQRFLGLKDDPLGESPVPDDRMKELGEFIKWTVGTRTLPGLVNSRQQKQFEQVLASPKALQHFRVKGDLDGSLLYTEYNAEEIAAKFREAAYTIEDTLTKLFDVRENPAVREAFSELEKAYRKARLNINSHGTQPEAE
jgi:ParB-like nuclease domain